MPLTVVADIQAAPGHEDFVGAALETLVPITRAEPGCARYDLHRDHHDPAHFLFYETWDSRELWQAHMNAPHLAAYLAATEGKVARFAVHEMRRVA
jgi:quinol monooxygenase YgiN